MIGKICITFWILPWLVLLGNPTEIQAWSGVLDESLDELHDVEIFRAVVDSMRQWESHKKNPHRTKREASRVCYEEVGCFEDTGPFSYLEMLPSHPKEVGTRFLMYGSRKARSIPMEVPADDINDKANNAIDPDLPTKVIVHGFGSGCDHVWVYEMRSALMSVHDCNIICVDWSLGSAIPNYVRAAANTRLVGRQLAKLVRSLNVPLEKVHLIGFSLGAHVAGFAGAELANVSRITGLDPAGPLFESQDPRARLDETDAAFVDVIHSNGEQLILGGLGSWQPMGDVDFYPNGGRMQTGCSNLFLGAVSDFIWSGSVEGRSLCNHRRAYKLFTDSVSPKCRFPAFPCDTGYDGLLKGDCFPCGENGSERPCGDMGYYSDASSARGQLYLVTREEEPFCAHQYQVKVYNSRSERPAKSYGKLQVTLVGENNFNETFTMTKKDDEELHVGALLQKIVVPHPAVSNLEAIEITYTAYSGWISSGLVTWSVDKIAVADSFGKSLSVCMRGLLLESGKPVYLPLYPGECNVPLELENSTTTVSTVMKFAAMKMDPADTSTGDAKPAGNIGPFTREQNYERVESFSVESDDSADDRNRPQVSLGPFTREQNYKITGSQNAQSDESIQISFVPKDALDNNLASSEGKKPISSPWAYVDVSDAGSNSLENSEVESGRAFSGSSFVASSSTAETPAKSSSDAPPANQQGEVREPVLQVAKKETGRSMRLPEITEPLLRPRATRQNFKGDSAAASQEDLQESSSSSSTSQQTPRAFTVQFLPERLAGILAQAERYARRTLLPLISQYTPSFVGSARQERVKYFPHLADPENDQSGSLTDGYVVDNVATSGNTERSNEVDASERQQSSESKISENKPKINSSRFGKEIEVREEISALHLPKQKSASVAAEDNKRESSESTSGDKSSEPEISKSSDQQSDWIPMQAAPVYTKKAVAETSRSERNSSRSLNYESYDNKWMSENGEAWKPADEDAEAGPDTKIDDWVPIVDKARSKIETTTKSINVDRTSGKAAPSATTKSPREVTSTSPKIEDSSSSEEKNAPLMNQTPTSDESAPSSNAAQSVEARRFIPLIDFENRDTFLAPNRENYTAENTESSAIVSSTERASHIQRIPGPAETREARESSATKRAMIFPYAYERKKDPRTRYIPLVPAEEMGTQNPLTERDR